MSEGVEGKPYKLVANPRSVIFSQSKGDLQWISWNRVTGKIEFNFSGQLSENQFYTRFILPQEGFCEEKTAHGHTSETFVPSSPQVIDGKRFIQIINSLAAEGLLPQAACEEIKARLGQETEQTTGSGIEERPSGSHVKSVRGGTPAPVAAGRL